MWELFRQPHNNCLIKQYVLIIYSRWLVNLRPRTSKAAIYKLNIEHIALVVDKIAHKFVFNNNFIIQYKCDILNSDKVIVLWNKSMPYTLCCSTINLIVLSLFNRSRRLGWKKKRSTPDCSIRNKTTNYINYYFSNYKRLNWCCLLMQLA